MRQAGRIVATPLLIALIVIETTDVIFALDSVPAVLAITREPFLVYTSNVFAMLGLRSLYFLLAGVVERFRFVRYGLAAILRVRRRQDDARQRRSHPDGCVTRCHLLGSRRLDSRVDLPE